MASLSIEERHVRKKLKGKGFPDAFCKGITRFFWGDKGVISALELIELVPLAGERTPHVKASFPV